MKTLVNAAAYSKGAAHNHVVSSCTGSHCQAARVGTFCGRKPQNSRTFYLTNNEVGLGSNLRGPLAKRVRRAPKRDAPGLADVRFWSGNRNCRLGIGVFATRPSWL